MTGKVSILVAVYNTEKYLRECLESLVNQTYRDLQIICINDASTDGSLAILKEYASRDNRILVIENKENLGQAKTRNHGIRYADGDFVAMVDSDDYLAPDAIEKAMKVFDESDSTDTVLLRLVLIFEKNGTKVPFQNRVEEKPLTGMEALEASLDWGIHGLYITRMRIQKEVLYDECVRYSGDDNTSRLHFLVSREVRFSEGEYIYRQHEESISYKISIRRFDVMAANHIMKKHLEERKVPHEFMVKFEQFCWYGLIGIWRFYLDNKSYFNESERKEIEEKFEYYASKIDNSLIPMRLKLRTLYIPFMGVNGIKLWAKYYGGLRRYVPNFLLKKRVKLWS